MWRPRGEGHPKAKSAHQNPAMPAPWSWTCSLHSCEWYMGMIKLPACSALLRHTEPTGTGKEQGGFLDPWILTWFRGNSIFPLPGGDKVEQCVGVDPPGWNWTSLATKNQPWPSVPGTGGPQRPWRTAPLNLYPFPACTCRAGCG